MIYPRWGKNQAIFTSVRKQQKCCRFCWRRSHTWFSVLTTCKISIYVRSNKIFHTPKSTSKDASFFSDMSVRCCIQVLIRIIFIILIICIRIHNHIIKTRNNNGILLSVIEKLECWVADLEVIRHMHSQWHCIVI